MPAAVRYHKDCCLPVSLEEGQIWAPSLVLPLCVSYEEVSINEEIFAAVFMVLSAYLGFVSCLNNNIDLDLDGLKDSVFSELLKFQGNAIRRDDITYLSFQPS